MYFGSTYATFFFSSLTVATHSCCACPDATNTHMQIDHVQKVSVATNAHVQTDLVGAAQKVMIECHARCKNRSSKCACASVWRRQRLHRQTSHWSQRICGTEERRCAHGQGRSHAAQIHVTSCMRERGAGVAGVSACMRNSACENEHQLKRACTCAHQSCSHVVQPAI